MEISIYIDRNYIENRGIYLSKIMIRYFSLWYKIMMKLWRNYDKIFLFSLQNNFDRQIVPIFLVFHFYYLFKSYLSADALANIFEYLTRFLFAMKSHFHDIDLHWDGSSILIKFQIEKDIYHQDRNEITLFRFAGSLKDLSTQIRDASKVLVSLQKFPASCHLFVKTYFPIFSNFRRGFSLQRNHASSHAARWK